MILAWPGRGGLGPICIYVTLEGSQFKKKKDKEFVAHLHHSYFLSLLNATLLSTNNSNKCLKEKENGRSHGDCRPKN